MSKPKNPSDIARETLIALAARKLAPTPENYAQMYLAISGRPAAAPSSPGAATGKDKPAPAWSSLIRNLLRQLETPHKGITLTRKKEGVETVLARFANDHEVLFDKLQNLLHSWSHSPAGSGAEAPSPSAAAGQPPALPPAAAGTATPIPADNLELLTQLRELLALTLDNMQSTHPELGGEIQLLAEKVRATDNIERLADLTKHLRQFWLKLELRGSDKTRVQEGLVRLLRLLLENISDLVEGDKWLLGQIAILQEIIANPLDRYSIADAERNMRTAVIKQGVLKQSLNNAKTTLKSLMTTFIDRLGDLTASTGEFNSKIENYSQKIGQADNLTELSHILKDVMHDSRIMQASAMRSHEELSASKQQADDAEARVKELEQELEQVSELVREDQLTGTLNRRGMDEAMEYEFQRSERSKTPVSLALLDIDNFKQLNDSLGHQAGDLALKHLTQVIKESLRPADSVGRYGGEEFIILLPETDLSAASAALQRLQRDLTRKFFLHNNERILVTFSAGVALRGESEDADSLIGRADKAMYEAKQTGKNRVVAAA